eukprot:5794577-Lingulodinium_polyedra.AAC.1
MQPAGHALAQQGGGLPPGGSLAGAQGSQAQDGAWLPGAIAERALPRERGDAEAEPVTPPSTPVDRAPRGGHRGWLWRG